MIDDFEEEGRKKGRKPDQRTKAFLIWKILMEEAAEDRCMTSDDIAAAIEDRFGIKAERKGVMYDIKALNAAFAALKEGCTISEAEGLIAEDPDYYCTIGVKHKQGYYIQNPPFSQLELLAAMDCLYASSAVSEKQLGKLSKIIMDQATKPQREKLKQNNMIVDRVKTTNDSVLNNISTINDAMSTELDGEPHEPEKITFKYVRYSINNVKSQVEKKQGARSKVSPFGLFEKNGHYYMLAYHDDNHHFYTYRVDRMKDVRFTNEPIDGKDALKEKGGVKAFANRRFSMATGKTERVVIHFDAWCLDMVIDRLGTKDVSYFALDKESGNFGIALDTEITPQFFAWISEFGKSAKIITENIAEKYQARLRGILESYES